MRSYQVINPIKQGGKVLRGGAVQLSDAEGARLTAQGFVSPIAAYTTGPDTTEAADPAHGADSETGGAIEPDTDATTSETAGTAPAGNVTNAGEGAASETEAGGGESPAAAKPQPVKKTATKRASGKRSA